MPVIVLSGEEEFLIANRLSQLKNDLLDPAWSSFNFARLSNPDLTEIIDTCAMVPFGAGNKFIQIDNNNLFCKSKAKSGTSSAKSTSTTEKDKQLKSLESSLEQVADNTYIVFVCLYNFDSSLKISKLVQKRAELESFPKKRYFIGQSRPDLVHWCQKHLKSLQATADNEAIQYLLDSFEGDLRLTVNELSKAAVYVLPNKHISLNVVQTLSPDHGHIFSVIDSWLEGQSSEQMRQKALLGIEEILSRQSAMPIIALLQTTLQRFINVKGMAEQVLHHLPAKPGQQRRQLPVPELAKRIAHSTQSGGKQTFILEMDLKRVHKVSHEWLIAKQKELCHLESLIKTGLMPEKHALILFFSC